MVAPAKWSSTHCGCTLSYKH